jgi:hypothetical protein
MPTAAAMSSVSACQRCSFAIRLESLLEVVRRMASSGSESKATLLSKLRDVTFFVAVYLYFTGFVYIYYFYDHFGIPLRVVDTPVYYYFVYSYNISWNMWDIRWADLLAQKSSWGSLTVILVLSAFLAVIRRDKRKSILLFACLAALFPLLSSLAFAAANVEAKKLRLGQIAKEITFVFKEDSHLPSPIKVVKGPAAGTGKPAAGAGEFEIRPPDQGESAEYESLQLLLSANKRTEMEVVNEEAEHPRLYLITETSNDYYVLYQPRLAGEAYEGYVFEIPKSIVLFTTVVIPEPKG